MQSKIDPQEVLDRARQEGEKWLAAFRPDGNPDIPTIVRELSARTHNGGPVLALVVRSPREAMPALVFGHALFQGQIEDQLRGQPRDQLRGQLRSQLEGQLWGQLGGQLRDQLWGQLWSQLESQIRDQLRGQLRGQLGSQLRGQIQDQLWDQIQGQLRDQLWGQLWSQLRGQLQGQLGSQLRGQIQDQLWDQIQDQLGDQWRCIWDYWLAAFYGCAYKVCPRQDHEFGRQSLLGAFAAGCGHIINNGSLIVGVCLPEAHRDAEMRIHREDGPAIIWGDEDPQYWWRGVRVPGEWITDKDGVDPTLALTHENIEQRRVLCEIIGWDRVLSRLSPEVVSRDDKGVLLRVDLPDHGLQQFVQVTCATGRQFAIPVPPDVITAEQGVARTYGVETYEPEFRT